MTRTAPTTRYEPIAVQRHVSWRPSAPETRPASAKLDADLVELVDMGKISLRRANALQAHRYTLENGETKS